MCIIEFGNSSGTMDGGVYIQTDKNTSGSISTF